MASEEIKLPSFSTTDPELWFESVDVLFSIGKTDGNKKYDYIKSLLPNHELYLDNYKEESEEDERYLGLRTHMIDRIKQEKVENIETLALYTCGDLKPSAFLTHLSVIMNDVIPESIKRTFWLARLPRRIQKVVMAAILKDQAPLEDKSLPALAALADGVAAYEKYHSWSSLPEDEAVTLPTYNQNDLELWFYLLDETFSTKDVTDDEVKFESTIKVLRPNDLFTASLFLTDLPNQTTCNRYVDLQKRLIKTLEVIKTDMIYRLVFRNIENLKPSQFYSFLYELASKSDKVIPELILRTLWIMQLPIKTQAILFQVIVASREPLQDMDIEALSLLADSAANSKKRMEKLSGCLQAPSLEDEDDTDDLETELETAKTLHEKIALGMRYCDYMYRVYYDNTPSESIKSCTVYDEEHFDDDLDAADYFARGCTCFYHANYGAQAYNCVQVQARHLIN